MENKRSNCAKIYIPFSFFRKRLIYDIVGLFYKLFDLVVGYILIKIDTNPVFFDSYANRVLCQSIELATLPIHSGHI